MDCNVGLQDKPLATSPHLFMCSLKWGKPLDKSSNHWKHSMEFVYTDIGPYCCVHNPHWVCPVLFKCFNRSQLTHLATSKNEYLCDCDCTRRDRCTPVRVPAATASSFLSQGEALHGTTLQGTAGWEGTVTRPTVQSACNQFEIGQNNNTQEQHLDGVYTLYTDAGHSRGIKSFSLSPSGQGGAES